MVKLDFDIEHDSAYKFNPAVMKELIADVFFQFMKEGLHTISTNEILHIIVPNKSIDRYDNYVYDLKMLSRSLKGHNLSDIYDRL